MNDIYPTEILDDDHDDGTMPGNVDELRNAVVGHRIVSAKTGTATAEINGWGDLGVVSGLVIELDDGTQVILSDTMDCCAYTSLEQFLLHPDKVDHIITGVGTTDSYETWHIYADLGDVLELTVWWSAGNPFYYGYGFDIHVSRIIDAVVVAALEWSCDVCGAKPGVLCSNTIQPDKPLPGRRVHHARLIDRRAEKKEKS